MQSLNHVTPLSGFTPASLRSQTYCSLIKEAFSKGYITTYETDLQKRSDDIWERETWLQRLNDFASGKGVDDPRASKHLICCYLFAVCISCDKEQAQKQQLVKECISHLDKDALENFYYSLQGSSTPTVVRLAILRYATTECWEKSFELFFRFSDMSPFENPLIQLMNEVAKNNWHLLEKQVFLDTMFSCLPKDRVEDLYCAFVLNATEDELARFTAACSSVLQQSVQGCTDQIRQYTQKIVQQLTESPAHVRLPYRQKSNQRHLFIAQFCEQYKECSVKDLISSDFDEADWLFLKSRKALQGGMSEFAVGCMIGIARRLQEGTLRPNSTNSHYGAHLWLFFSNCSGVIEKNRGYSDLPKELYIELARALQPTVLVDYFNAFKGEFATTLMKLFLDKEPAKIVEWMKLLTQHTAEFRSSVSENMGKLFSQVDACQGTTVLVSQIFTPENSDIFTLTAFAAAPRIIKAQIVKTLFSNKDAGAKTIERWVALATPRVPGVANVEGLRVLLERLGLSKQATLDLPPFVREALVSDLHKLIIGEDPALSLELKNRLASTFQDASAALEFIDLLLPTDVDLNDPVARSRDAFKKLKSHFETPHIPHKDREQFVRSIDEDLRGEFSKEKFVTMLFDALEPQSWPLIFLYFNHDVTSSSYNNYYEEKTGGLFKKVNKHAPATLVEEVHQNKFKEVVDEKMTGLATQLANGDPSKRPNAVRAVVALQDIAMWNQMAQMDEVFGQPVQSVFNCEQQLIDVASIALTHMIENPCLYKGKDDSPAAWAMQQLYQATCETNTIHAVMQRFVAICPPEKFIATIHLLAHAAFHSNSEGCIELIAGAIEEAKGDDKTAFILDCLTAPNKYRSQHSGMVNLERAFWEEPFLKTDHQRAVVARGFVQRLGVQFLSHFMGYSQNNEFLIKSLHVTDPEFCKQLFMKMVKALTVVNNDSLTKVTIFRNFCYAYSEAGCDLFSLLALDECKQLEPILSSWYTLHGIDCIDNTLLSWQLMNHYGRDLVIPIALQKVAKAFSKGQGYWDFDRVVVQLKKLGYLETLKEKIHEDQQLFGSIIKAATDDMGEVISSTESMDSLTIIFALVPDWRVLLAAGIRATIKQEKQSALSWGGKPSYYKVEQIFKALQKHDLLSEILKEIVKNGHENLQNEIDSISKKVAADSKKE